MESKSLLFGIIGFIAGGLIVSIAATIEQPQTDMGGMSMSSMSKSLETASGKEYDELFINQMIEHHQGALDMAKLSADRAERTEIKQFSNDVITAQSKEIQILKTWQSQWNNE